MGKCKVCGKQIPNRLTYCSDECAEKDKAQTTSTQAKNSTFLSQWDKGHGSVRRETNIHRVIEMFERGLSEEDIRYELSFLFRPSTVDDYLRLAKEYLRRKNR
jgi:hypothetical protein